MYSCENYSCSLALSRTGGLYYITYHQCTPPSSPLPTSKPRLLGVIHTPPHLGPSRQTARFEAHRLILCPVYISYKSSYVTRALCSLHLVLARTLYECSFVLQATSVPRAQYAVLTPDATTCKIAESKQRNGVEFRILLVDDR